LKQSGASWSEGPLRRIRGQMSAAGDDGAKTGWSGRQRHGERRPNLDTPGRRGFIPAASRPPPGGANDASGPGRPFPDGLPRPGPPDVVEDDLPAAPAAVARGKREPARRRERASLSEAVAALGGRGQPGHRVGARRLRRLEAHRGPLDGLPRPLFSTNVPLEKEVELKERAEALGCGHGTRAPGRARLGRNRAWASPNPWSARADRSANDEGTTSADARAREHATPAGSCGGSWPPPGTGAQEVRPYSSIGAAPGSRPSSAVGGPDRRRRSAAVWPRAE